MQTRKCPRCRCWFQEDFWTKELRCPSCGRTAKKCLTRNGRSRAKTALEKAREQTVIREYILADPLLGYMIRLTDFLFEAHEIAHEPTIFRNSRTSKCCMRPGQDPQIIYGYASAREWAEYG